jgi:hypothetical protein
MVAGGYPIHTTSSSCKGTTSLVMLTIWWLWKHRNTIVFDNALPNAGSPLDTIRSEARSWANAGAVGLWAMIPDVA